MRRLVLALSLLAAAPARADEHAHHHHHQHGEVGAPVLAEHRHGYGASLGVVLANYEAPLFLGDYQGTSVGGWWMQGRFGLAVSVPAYRLTKNGRTVDGLGDVMAHGHAMLLTRGRFTAHGMMMVSVPTGDGDEGLGMGDAMLMPAIGGRWTGSRIALAAHVGYGYMVGGAGAHAEHGQKMWPLVEPMNAQEITVGGSGMVALSGGLAAELHGQAAAPIGDGDTRVIGGVRVVWLAGRTETSFRVDHGFAGSPFDLRGMLETSVRFD